MVVSQTTPLKRHENAETEISSCLINAQIHFHLEFKLTKPLKMKLLAKIKQCFSTNVYVKIPMHNLSLCQAEMVKVIAKLLKVAKPKFRFGHFQEFCDNIVNFSTSKQNMCINIRI